MSMYETLAIIIATVSTGVGIVVAVGVMLRSQRKEFREDLRDLRLEIRSVREEVRGEIRELREELHREIEKLREELHREIEKLREELHREIEELQEEISGVRRDQQGINQRMAAIDGLIEGLREAVIGRSAA